MEAFPFTETEWAAVNDAALPIVNAELADDAVLSASLLLGLRDVLTNLRERYGEHPVLLETEADFAEDDGERVVLYERAIRVALANGLPALTIRLSLAQLLMELGRPTAARVELLACENEVSGGDESDRASWAALLEQSNQGEPCPAEPRAPGLHAGMIQPSRDFDAPLPDDFWAGQS